MEDTKDSKDKPDAAPKAESETQNETTSEKPNGEGKGKVESGQKAEPAIPQSKKAIRAALNKRIVRKKGSKTKRKSKMRDQIRTTMHQAKSSRGTFSMRLKILVALTLIACLVLFTFQGKVAGEKKIDVYKAAQAGNYEDVMTILGKYPEYAALPEGESENTMLHYACQSGSLETVRALIELNAPIGKTNKFRQTPMHFAAKYGHGKIIELLLKKDALVRMPDRDRMQPIHYAASNGHVEAIELLLGSRAKTTSLSDQNMTPLHHACLGKHPEAVQVLIQNGADVSAQNAKGLTPLHIAVLRESPEIVKILLKAGAHPGGVNGERSPLDLAKEDGNSEIISLLEQALAVSAGAKK